MSILNNIVFFVLALSILVAVHEWGHYYVAKLCKVKILRFSIGFGKPLYKRVTSSGMEFVIAAIPLGGYVRMLDGRVDPVNARNEHLAFNFKPVWQRIAIVAAGPLVNLIFAVLISMCIGLLGKTTIKPVIGEIEPQSVFANAGVESKDLIVKVGNAKVNDWRDVSIEMATYSGEDTMPVSIVDNRGTQKNLLINLKGWELDPESSSIFDSFGITPFRPEISTRLARVLEDSPAARSNLQVNDEILKIDGTNMDSWEQIVSVIADNPNQTLVFDIERDGSIRSLDVTFGQSSENPSNGYLGVIAFQEPWPEEYLHEVDLSLSDAVVYGFQDTWRLITVTFKMLEKLVTGDISVKNLSGPISIAQGAGQSANVGLIAFLGFLALISVNLGILNLLPLPILDGGHLMYFFIEWITGKPVSEAIQEIGFRIGGVILFAVMATAIFNDILRNI